MEHKKINYKRLVIILLILALFIGLIVWLYFSLGLNKEFKDIESLRNKILSYGNMSYFIYILINFLQTTIIPISNIPTIMAGEMIFGPFLAATLATVGVLIGSMVSFAIGKVFGKKAIEWVIGKETVDKYLAMTKNKEKWVVFAILLLPGFPDDIICMIAGVTSMSWKFFIISILITRTIPSYMIAYSSDIIPINTPWGIITWVLIYLVVLLISRYIIKNWEKVNNFIEKHDNKTNK